MFKTIYEKILISVDVPKNNNIVQNHCSNKENICARKKIKKNKA